MISAVANAAKLLALLLLLLPLQARAQASAPARPLLPAPIWVYNNWSAYDELSDDVPLTEALAMRELGEIERLKKSGVRFDYYMMDAFWYDPDGGYRRWRAGSWPDGPGKWLASVKADGVKPGLWFSTNTLTHMHAAPQWEDSMSEDGHAMALYTGGFLADFMDVLDYWYGNGVRMFKFDMADFNAIAKKDEGSLSPHEARLRNLRAFHAALQSFRRSHPDMVLVGFNGLVGDIESAAAPVIPLNASWLDVFDTFYSGDPRPSNVPEMNFWRSVDLYSDEMVRSFEQAGIPLPRIDSTSVMIGDTETNYHRRTGAWKGSLLLMASHGGWIDTVHGDLSLLDDADARWLAEVQAIYEPLQKAGITKSFGGIPGDAYPYGFGSVGADGSLYAVVNPSERVRAVRLPQLSPSQPRLADGRVLFRDSGFDPAVQNGSVQLGPGQLALVGFGEYASPSYDLGMEPDVVVPRRIERLRAQFTAAEEGGHSEAEDPVEATVTAPATGGLRIVLSQIDEHGEMMRSVSAKDMGKVFSIEAWQEGKRLPVATNYDKVIWSGLAWGVGEIRGRDIAPGKPILIRLATTDPDASLHLAGEVYRVEY